MLAILYSIYAFGPFSLICFHFLAHIFKIFVGSFLITYFCISSHLAHNLCKHFISWLLTGVEPIGIHFSF